MPHPLSQRISDVLALDPVAPAIQYEGQWLPWGQLDDMARQIGALTARHGNGDPPRVGILLRNSPAHVGALLGVLAGGGTVVVINPSRGDERTRADISALRLPLVIGTPADIANLVTSSSETTLVAISTLAEPPEVTPAAAPAGDPGRPGVAVWMLTSGTTGPPKRVDLTYNMLARSVIGRDPDQSPAPTRLRTGVAIVNSPLVHVGGVFRVLLCIAEARPFVLLPKFELQTWAQAVREHRPRAVSLVPAALRMVLHSDLTREDLASVRAVTSGTAPLSADDADAFTEKFGIPVLTSYAATEFGGGVAGWTLADHQRHWHDKRGSVGRANPGAQLRVVDDDGCPSAPDEQGLLEVKPAQLGAGRGVDAHHRPGADRRRRVSVDSRTRRSGDHPGWVQGHARRRAHARWRAIQRYRAQPWWATATSASARPRSQWSSCEQAPSPRPVTSSTTYKPGWRATRFPPASRSSTRYRGPRRASPT